MKLRFSISRISGLLAMVILLSLVLIIPVQANPGAVLVCGYGTPNINGVMALNEWNSAGYIEFPMNTPEGGTTPGAIYAMHDDLNLYLAVRFNRQPPGINDSGAGLDFQFDNNHNGIPEAGDDALVFGSDGNFYDDFRNGAGNVLFDTSDGGTNDGGGAFGYTGTMWVLELVHPLDSADDAHDFSLKPGNTVGFSANISILSLINGQWHEGRTTFPASAGYEDIIIGQDLQPEPELPSVPGVSIFGIGTLILLSSAVLVWKILKKQVHS